MKNQAFSRKKRQLKAMSAKLRHLMDTGAGSSAINEVAQKIKRLLAELRHVISRIELQRALGGLAILFGFAYTNEAKAQVSFGPPQTNPYGLTPATYTAVPAFTDLDNDGDLDLMVGEYYGGLKYFENTGTAANPQFAAPVVAPFGIDTSVINMIAAPAFADLDGDGDMDLMVGHSDYTYNSNLLYFENTGTPAAPQFGAPQTQPFGVSPNQLFAFPAFADLDADGDMDLMIGQYSGELAYFENTGTATAPQFGAAQASPFGLGTTYIIASPAFADLDQDGDYDLLVGELYNYYGGGAAYAANLQYFENTGTAASPQFAAPQVNPFGTAPAYYYGFPAFADLDNDGDEDLLVGEYYGAMKYYENTSNFSIDEMAEAFGAELFPNPAVDYVQIDTREHIARVEVLDLGGKLLMVVEKPQGKIATDKLATGSYLIKLINSDDQAVIRKLNIN